MRKLLVLALMLAGAAFAREASIYVGTGAETPDIWDGSPGDVYFGAAEFEVDGVTRCDGAVTLGDNVADAITITGTMTLGAATSFPAGSAALPSINFTGSLTTGLYQSAADEVALSVATANVGTWDAAGYSGALGQTTPAAADVTTLTTTGLTDLFAGAVGAPSVTFTGSATSGLYEIAADNIGMAIGGALVGDFDATGLNNCDVGQTTPGAADVTTLTTTGLTDLFAGAVGAPSVSFTGSATSGLYEIAADNIGMAIGGALVGDFDATGLNNCPIGQTTPGAADVTTLTTTGLTDLFAGAVGAPSVSFTGSATSGLYEIAADNIGMAIGGALVGDFDATGLNNCPIGQTTPGAADVTTLTTTGITDLFAGAVGAPSVTFTGSATTGFYEVAADSPGVAVGGANVTTWDGTGIIATGINGPLGTVTPAAVTATDVDVGGDFNFGQDPIDLIGGYKDRSDYITFQDDFTVSVDTEYVLDWDLTTVVGLGTNTVSVRPGWSELVTGGAGVDSESTRSWGLSNYRAYAPRIESVVDLTNLVTQRFEWGFWAAANEYVLIAYDVAVGANWILQVDDTAGVETIDSTVAATVNPTKLEIRVAADGTVTWAIDDVVMTVVGLTNQMTANPHYTWWELTDTAAVAHTVAVDYVQIEQLKQQ